MIVIGFEMCLMETACTDCFSVAIGPGSDMSLMETACDGCFEVLVLGFDVFLMGTACDGCSVPLPTSRFCVRVVQCFRWPGSSPPPIPHRDKMEKSGIRQG